MTSDRNQKEVKVSQPFQQQGLSRADRRAAQERARLRREAFEAAQESGFATPLEQAPVSSSSEDSDGAQAPKVKKVRTRRKKQSRPGLRFALGVLTASLGFMAALSQGGPVLGHDWDYAALAAGIGILLAGGMFAWWNSLQTTKRTTYLTLGTAGLLCTAFTIGTFNSVVVNGEVYATTSDTAQAYRLSQELRADLEYIADADQLLDAEQADARTRYADYGPTAERLADISQRWSTVASKPEDLPSAGFAEVATHTANGAHWASEAMARKQELIVEPDARGDADVNSYRATYAQEVLTAGPQLVEVARLYGISLTEEGPVE